MEILTSGQDFQNRSQWLGFLDDILSVRRFEIFEGGFLDFFLKWNGSIPRLSRFTIKNTYEMHVFNEFPICNGEMEWLGFFQNPNHRYISGDKPNFVRKFSQLVSILAKWLGFGSKWLGFSPLWLGFWFFFGQDFSQNPNQSGQDFEKS